MAKTIKYYIVAADALPEIFIKVAEAKRMMQTGEAETVGAATRLAGISRSAFYKYKDSVQPFNDMKSEHIITFYGMLKDTSGVLSRVAGLFSRRGYNIDSLTVGVTADERYSRMTVVSYGDQNILEQIEKQLRKLEDVRDIKELKPGHSVYRELIMVKVRANASQRQAVSAISDIFRATIVDVGKDSLTVMLTGDQSKLDALINLLEDYEILELARTGLTGLSRGSDDIRYLP